MAIMLKQITTLLFVLSILLTTTVLAQSDMDPAVDAEELKPFANEASGLDQAVVDEQLRSADSLLVNTEFLSAVEAYQGTISTIEEAAGEYSPLLIEVLFGYGKANKGIGDTEAAVNAFQRGQHIIHRSQGVHALTQLRFLEEQITIALQQEEPLEADKLQRLMLYLAEQNFGDTDARLLPYLDDLGKWFMETGQFHQAKRTFEKMETIISDSQGEYSLELIEPLRRLAMNKRMKGTCCAYKPLLKVVEIMDNNPGVSDQERVDIYTEIADAYLIHRKREEAAEYYDKAWRLLSSEEALQRFDEPQQLAMTEMLEEAAVQRSKTFQPDQPDMFDPYRITDPTRLRPSNNPSLYPNQEPSQFRVMPQTTEYHVLIRDPIEYSLHDRKHRTLEVIGQPVQFIFKQLQYVMPQSIRNRSDLADLTIKFSFTVNEKGNASKVNLVSSNAPSKLNRIMRDVIRKSKFRPRLVDGRPVATENVNMIQTFIEEAPASNHENS